MRTLIIAFLFVFTMDTLGQAIPRFLFRPIVRPFAPMPEVWVNPANGVRVNAGTPGAVRLSTYKSNSNSYNPTKNGGNDTKVHKAVGPGVPNRFDGFDVNASWWAWQDPNTLQLFATNIDPLTGLPELNALGQPRHVRVNKFNMAGIDSNGNPVSNTTQTFGSWENRRITRWSTKSRGGNILLNPPKNTKLRLIGTRNQGTNFFRAPQRPMIDDTNASASYNIPTALLWGATPGSPPVYVRPQHRGYKVTDYGVNDGITPPATGSPLPITALWNTDIWTSPVGDPFGATSGIRATTQPSTQLGIFGEWTNCYYWMDFNLESIGRAGLVGLMPYSLAGLPYDQFVPPFTTTGTLNGAGPANEYNWPQNVWDLVSDATLNSTPGTTADSIELGMMIKVSRASQQIPNSNPATFRWNLNSYTYTRVPIGTDGVNESSSSLSQYNRSLLFTMSSFFGNYFINGGVIAGNQNNNGNAGTGFGLNPSANGNLVSTRSMANMLQYGSLNIKLRMLMRMPQLGPEFLFLNLQNPIANGRPNIMY